jgi:transcriptional regulator with XRE-family HTH domain
MKIGEKIKTRRMELGWSLQELADRMGYANKSTVARIESGVIDPPQSKVVKFAEVLHTNVAYLMDWEKVQKKNDILSDIILKMNEDAELLTMVETLSNLGFEQREAVKSVLNAFSKAEK